MQKHIHLYIDRCQACQRSKTHHEQPRNPLHPNRIPTEPWTHVSSDLITGLQESGGFNAILVVVDRFSKNDHTHPNSRHHHRTTNGRKLSRSHLETIWNA